MIVIKRGENQVQIRSNDEFLCFHTRTNFNFNNQNHVVTILHPQKNNNNNKTLPAFTRKKIHHKSSLTRVNKSNLNCLFSSYLARV
jgi:hypothetical protein